MSNITFNIGDHSSFTEEVGAEGSLNFLTYDTMKHIGLCIKKNDETYGLGTMRLVPISRDTPNDDNGNVTLLSHDDSCSTLIKELNYKILPIFIEFTDVDQNFYNLYYHTNISTMNGMTFYCPNNNIQIVNNIDTGVFSWMRVRNSINWIDF
jgi:hypothetical protein